MQQKFFSFFSSNVDITRVEDAVCILEMTSLCRSVSGDNYTVNWVMIRTACFQIKVVRQSFINIIILPVNLEMIMTETGLRRMISDYRG